MLHRVLDLDRFVGMTKTMENGRETWNLECKEFLQIKVAEDGRKRISTYKLQLVGVQGIHGTRDALNEQRIKVFQV